MSPSNRSLGVQGINFTGSDLLLQRLPHAHADSPLNNTRRIHDTGHPLS